MHIVSFALRRSAQAACAALIVAGAGGAHAGALTLAEPVAQFENVQIFRSASGKVDDVNLNLTLLGRGLREKSVFVTSLKIYVAQLFGSASVACPRDASTLLTSVSGQPATAMRLDFVYDVDASRVVGAFSESLKKNNVNLAAPEIKKLLDLVKAGGDVESGDAITFIGYRGADGGERVAFESAKGDVQSVQGPAGFIHSVFSMWLGEPSESKILELQKQLLECGG